MENKKNKSKNSNAWLCRHNDSKIWQPACGNCQKDIKAWQKTINSLSKKQCYLVTFGDVGKTSKQSEKVLTLLEKIPKVIKKKMVGRIKNEVFFALPILPETKINEKGEEVVAVEIEGDKFKLNFLNQFMKVLITWRREERALMEKKPYIGLVCRIQKIVHP